MDIVHDIVERPSRTSGEVKFSLPEQQQQSRKPKSLWRSRLANRNVEVVKTNNLGPRSGSVKTDITGEKQLDPTSEAGKIDKENWDRITSMSPEEIAAEKEELQALLPASLIKKILNRDRTKADKILASGRSDANIEQDKKHGDTIESLSTIKNHVALEDEIDEAKALKPLAKSVRFDENVTVNDVTDTTKIEQPEDNASTMTTHFPAPESNDLNPDDPEFFEKLHDKYFPDLPAEPSRLAWMKPITQEEDKSSPYNPDQDAISPVDIRFDFKGSIVPPSKSATLPTNLGLHHHSDSPGYAGYTIAELGHLSRSAVSAQRAMAIQVMGRILYRLGTNSYGEFIGEAIWDIVEHVHVIDSIYEASDEKKTRHLGLRTSAVEALWLWKKGGGRRRKTD
ncbi:RPAP1-like protein [Lipomyces japonicus]|uniref:RPAP1-like protein n=1 Tax=Lipomyces japonicus TaxID=56871 RepID=UPI0034CEB33E